MEIKKYIKNGLKLRFPSDPKEWVITHVYPNGLIQIASNNYSTFQSMKFEHFEEDVTRGYIYLVLTDEQKRYLGNVVMVKILDKIEDLTNRDATSAAMFHKIRLEKVKEIIKSNEYRLDDVEFLNELKEYVI